ncbi:MAG TPA: Ppx/GppA phosphatase family protein [bacterium]|nr:Ppx/GppA phosphatase family protein [bacterium]
MRIAVIDLGTNSVHMLMAEIHPNFTFEVLGREKEMARLGDGTMAKRYLSRAVMERGLATIRKFYFLAQSKGIQKIVAVATSAVREAHNGGEFIQKIRKETKIRVRVITGEEEGRLIYLGVKHSLELQEGNTLIIDIGGGSVEILVVNPQRILFLKSLKLGAARLKQLFLKEGGEKEIHRMEKYVTAQLKSIAPQIKALGVDRAIGTSGTLQNLGAMAVGGARADTLSYEDLKELYDRLIHSTAEERAAMKGLDPLRNDLIVSGAASAFLAMKIFKLNSISLCDKAIREGMVYDYIARNRFRLKSEETIPDVRLRNVLRLASKCNYEKTHAEHSAKLALQIFDQTRKLHRLEGLDRELLNYASLLHDIGYHIGFSRHHHHAYYLIKNSGMNGFSQEELDILALVARYHRRSLPKSKHSEWAKQGKAIRHRVKWLAGILRIADALDRSHFGVVDSVEVKLKKKEVSFLLSAHNDAEYELWDARQKCDLFEKLTGRDLFFLLKEKAAMPSGKVLRGPWDRDSMDKANARLKRSPLIVK